MISFIELMEKAKTQDYNIHIFELSYVEIRIHHSGLSTSYNISFDDLTQNQKSFIHFISRQYLYTHLYIPKDVIYKIIEIIKEASNVAIARNNVYIDYIDNE